MAKATDKQVKDTRKALAEGTALPKGMRINFGDPEPIRKATADDVPDSASTDET